MPMAFSFRIWDFWDWHSGSHVPVHASTQCDVRTAEKVRWLKSLGFSRVVLAASSHWKRSGKSMRLSRTFN
jgi:hypothetical protein